MSKVFTFLMLISIFTIPNVLAQELTVSGKVSGDDGTSLPGVNVVIKGLSTGSITDLDGNYKLVISSKETVLIYSFIGYKSSEETVGSRSVINVTLYEDVTALSEVVVTAFGVKQEKKALGYSVQQIKSDELMESRQTNVVNALQGRVAGVRINSSSGQPGAGSSIVIRGISSLNPSANNQPLIIIDGIVMSNDTDVASINPSAGSNSINSSEQGSNSNRLADINPDDVESMNVLKGPAAAALYGVRAANGAIIITTKSGKSGKTVVSLTSTQGWDVLGIRPEVQTKYREGRYGRLRYWDDGSPLRFQTLGPRVRDGDPVYDNIESLFQTGHRAEYNVSVSGGTDKARFYTSFNNLKQTGITPFSDWGRTAVRVKGDISASDKLTIRSSINYTRSGGNISMSGDKSIMSALSYMSPTFDGSDYQNPDGSMKLYTPYIDNPRYVAEFVKYTNVVNRISGSIGFNWKITPWLSANYTLGADSYNDTRNRFVPPGLDVSSQTGGFIVDININRREINSNFLLTANKQFTEDLEGSITLGNQIVDKTYLNNTRRGETFLFPDFNHIDNTTNLFGEDIKTQYRSAGFFIDAKINYRGIAYFNFTGRNDISSALPEANRNYFYPGASLGLIFSEMLPANSILSYGKLRGSYAQVGKDTNPHKIGFSYEGASAFPFGATNGFRKSTTAGDENLKPETTTSFEIGADLRFANNRIGLDATYYKQTSMDMILDVPLSNTTGLSRYLTNAGEMENTGIELMLNAQIVKTSSLTWDLDINWAKNEGKVISVAEGIDEIPLYEDRITSKMVPNGKVGDLYGYAYNRTDDGQLILDEGYPTVALDTAGEWGHSVVGNALPDFIAGFNNRITYKGLTLSALLEWRHGGDVFDMALINGVTNGILKDSERRYERVIFKGVKVDGTDENGNPAYVTNDVDVDITADNNFYKSAPRYNYIAQNILQDASWLRLRTASLSYQIPIDLIAKIGMTAASITFTGNNLFINTPYKGFDPESNYFGSSSNISGFTGLTVPGTKSYLFTLNLKF